MNRAEKENAKTNKIVLEKAFSLKPVQSDRFKVLLHRLMQQDARLAG